MPPPPLPTKDAFRDSTKNSNPFAMRKGIARIDEALSLWEKGGHNLDNAVLVYRECRHWLLAKQGEDGENTSLRRQKVNDLLGKMVMWLNHFDPRMGTALTEFERRKDAGAHPQAKPMPGVYAFERNAYLDKNKKIQPPSATRLNDFGQGLGAAGTLPAKFPDHFSQLTEKQFAELDKMCKERHSVLYLKKIDRLKYMLRALPDGKLYDYDGNLGATLGTDGWPYAMDRYGSLFVINQHTPGQQINHSTLNAGKEVTCAGMLKVEAGVVKKISNNSGHYKPSQKELHNAVQALAGERVDLTQARVELWDYDQEPGRYHVWDFAARDFPVSGHVNGVHVGAASAIGMPMR